MNSKVYIAGAGSGDIGNLTLKALDIIKKADIILYDHLVSDEIILLSKIEALLIDVGKISGYHKVKQDDINQLLLEYSKSKKIVLRLKGGDPFIFGRGSEEAQFLFENNVDFEIIPAVTSVSSVPASMGIPLTHRNVSASFVVVTGRKKSGELLDEEDFKNLANFKKTTLVFMMSAGISNYIAKGLIKSGANPNTPAVIISNGTTANSKKYLYTLDSLSKIENTDIFEMPAILLVGDVISLGEKLLKNKLLYDKRIIINVPRQKNSSLEAKLYELGAQVVNLSTNTLQKKYSYQDFFDILDNIVKYEYLCFTSSFAVEVFFSILYEHNIDIRRFNMKFCVIGISTAESLKNKNIIPDIIPSDYNAKALADELLKKNADNILCVLPHNIQSDLFDILTQNKLNVRRFDIYEKIMDKVRLYNELNDDIFVFTSSSSVEGLVLSYKENHFKSKLCFCIGEKTENTAKKFGFKTVVSEISAVDSLIDKILEYYNIKKL